MQLDSNPVKTQSLFGSSLGPTKGLHLAVHLSNLVDLLGPKRLELSQVYTNTIMMMRKTRMMQNTFTGNRTKSNA